MECGCTARSRRGAFLPIFDGRGVCDHVRPPCATCVLCPVSHNGGRLQAIDWCCCCLLLWLAMVRGGGAGWELAIRAWRGRGPRQSLQHVGTEGGCFQSPDLMSLSDGRMEGRSCE